MKLTENDFAFYFAFLYEVGGDTAAVSLPPVIAYTAAVSVPLVSADTARWFGGEGGGV